MGVIYIKVAKMPLNLAILSPNKADDIINKYNDVETWVIGGHSLGGVMAAKYAADNEKIKGVVFFAAYPQGDTIKGLDIDVLSIYGSNDGVSNKSKIKNASLPDNSDVIEIKGGNHANFGDYGNQKGDNKASISREKQISSAADLVSKFMNKI